MSLLNQIPPFILFMLGLFIVIQLPFVLLSLIIALREKHHRAVYVPVDESEALPRTPT